MKPIATLLMILLFSISYSQNNNYSELWKAVNKQERQGLPESALKIVKKIEAKAYAEDNTEQRIKVLLFKSRFAFILEENAQLKIIKNFKSEISKSKAPTKNVLQNMLATLYWQYYTQNRYQFYNRTKTREKADATDFRTWDLETLFNEIKNTYDKSLSNGLILQQTPISQFEAILTKGEDTKTYRPTLFDLLNHNALKFYKTTQNSITQPAYKFIIKNPKYLSTSKEFSTLKIKSKDSSSLQLQALKVYQNLIQFHLKDNEPYALTNVNIARLNFVNKHATFNNKEAIYLEALQAEAEKNKAHEVSALYNFKIASIYKQQGEQYNKDTNATVRFKTKDALTLCKQIIKDFPDSKGAKLSNVLQSQILQPKLSITSEKFVPINQHLRFLISYKNVEQIRFNAYKLSKKQLDIYYNLHHDKEETKIFIDKLKFDKNWTSTLRNESDYLEHSTEVLVPKLDNGFYLIVGQSTDLKDNFLATVITQVTNIAIIDFEDQNQRFYQIVDRNNGQPLANAKVTIEYFKNDEVVNTVSTTSNYDGIITITKANNYNRQGINLTIKTKTDTAHIDNYHISTKYRNKKNNETKYKAFIFTDRSIYRPSQTIYFKAITLKNKTNNTNVYTNQRLEVILYNTNHEIVSSKSLTTNSFGSVSGEFILPNDGLTGNYRIVINHKNVAGNTNISVEEYKRSKFETKFNPIKETFKVNDSVTVKGEAIAFAGSKITDAKVVYRVVRNVQFPSWYRWYKPIFNSSPQEIAQGETTTDVNGNYKVIFKAIPDETVDQSGLPIFSYTITADVTDINGETRSASTTVKVGYHALTANIGVAPVLDKSKKNNEITITTNNLNGQFVPAKGTLKIYKLQAPNTVLRPRVWAAPDYQDFNKKDFNNYFPHDAYTNEDKQKNWTKGDLVLIEKFDTDKSKVIALKNIKKWLSGAYIIELDTKDKFGQEVKDKAKTTLFSNKDKLLADKQLLTVTTDKTDYKVGENLQLTLATAAKNITVTVSLERKNKIVKNYIVTLNQNKKTISIPIKNGDLGGFCIHYSLAAFNSFKESTMTIKVPYPKTELEIETLTFRDKLQPGTDETWSFKIKGTKGEKIASEFLASMYDASLDQFKKHYWSYYNFSPSTYYTSIRKESGKSFGRYLTRYYTPNEYNTFDNSKSFDQFKWFGIKDNSLWGNNYYDDDPLLDEVVVFGVRNKPKRFGSKIKTLFRSKRKKDASSEMESDVNTAMVAHEMIEVVEDELDDEAHPKEIVNNNSNKQEEFGEVKARTNLQETAFFFPKLTTDTKGNVSFNFKTPEALTRWNLNLFAHDKKGNAVTSTLQTVTQKELMVLPNAPRFLRQGDQIQISTKIANISDTDVSGLAMLQLFDALTGQPIDIDLSNSVNQQPFSVIAKGNTQVTWSLTIPNTISAVQYKILAKAGSFSDGEQNVLPVLTNRMLVTETLPMWVKSNQTKTFTLDKLKTNTSTTLKHHKLTLEMTSNPAWYAVQALPYLMEYPYECNEQTFSRYYANSLASHIVNSNPRIKTVFFQWKNTDALLSNLEKNQELKSILIQETPWLRDAQSETEQKKRIALLFDLNKMNNELSKARNKLKNNQMASGGWSWFGDYRANRYITQHIISGFGHLKKLNVYQSEEDNKMIQKALRFLDFEFEKEYNNLKKYNNAIDYTKDHLSNTQLHYLYMRSFFKDYKQSENVKKIHAYYLSQIKSYWLKRPLYEKGMMALIMNRNNHITTANAILKSLKETSITSDELGMYWKENTNSYYWYQAPVETQSLIIEAFTEAGTGIQNEIENTKTIDNLKIWLLKNKQTNKWKTTKATTEAVYALLLEGSDWLNVTDMVDATVGNTKITPKTLKSATIEAGTGYYKTSWAAAEIKPEMAKVTLNKKGPGIAWGALYWQYFEDLDNITPAETPLKLKKQLYLKTNTDKGEVITAIAENTILKVGDLVRVRIELRSDRAMEFVHMKDMRAAGLEPINTLSRYKYQDGLGYYEATKDASTNFFFDYLPKGVFVFEYDLRVNNAGNMSNGITTIQSMYAPEFSSHSEGVRIEVE